MPKKRKSKKRGSSRSHSGKRASSSNGLSLVHSKKTLSDVDQAPEPFIPALTSSPSDPPSNEKILNSLTNLVEELGIDALNNLGFDDINKCIKEDRQPLTALEQAQELVHEAFEATRSSERIRLAKKALYLSMDCIDAYVILAEELADSPEKAIWLYEKAIEAGRKALGEELFMKSRGAFWGIIETRPFIRALRGLGGARYSAGDKKGAVEAYQEILALNKHDNMGVRYELVYWLIELEDHTNAERVFEAFPDDCMAAFSYGRALLSFAQEGECQESNMLLKEALSSNEHVPRYLLGLRRLPKAIPHYHGVGDENEAVICTLYSTMAWHGVAEASDWLCSTAFDKKDIAMQLREKEVFETIESFSLSSLMELQEHITHEIERKEQDAMRLFSIGEEVSFSTREGRRVYGRVMRINKKTITVQSKNNSQWKVSPVFIEKTDRVIQPRH